MEESRERNPKRPRREVVAPPSLFTLCTQRATRALPELSPFLHTLPDSLSVPLLQAFLSSRAPSVAALRQLCEGVAWAPRQLSLCGAIEPVFCLPARLVLLRNLVRLDLRGCVWVPETLAFLPSLRSLECLRLGGCWRVPAHELTRLREVPQLQCLDVENMPAVTDEFAPIISAGMTSLRALNVSGTLVSDCFVEVLTYGSRLRAWEEENRVKGLRLATSDVQTLLSQYPVSSLTWFRFQATQITDATIAHLQALPHLLLLDVRQATKVTARSVSSLRAKHKLIALPNNARLAARTNAMLGTASNGECGCRSMATPQHQIDEATDDFTKLSLQAFSQLLHKPPDERELFWS